jgi:transposase-like protein
MVVENDEKKQCPYCKSKEVKLNGKTKQGRQRYQCLKCKKTYLWKQNKSKDQRRYNWFKQWMLEGYTIKQLAKINKVSSSTVSRVINYWLKKQPPNKVKDLEEVKHVLLDGTYIKHRTGIYVIMDGKGNRIVYGGYGISETGKHLKSLYDHLRKEGLNPLSATIDGSTQQFKFLTEVWSNLKVQRCLVHIQRQGLSWLRQKPKRIEAIELRELLLQVIYIKTREQSENFIKGFKAWENRFGPELKVSRNRGRVFSDLLRARTMIINALPYMFKYLDDPEISRTTNALEGYFGRLKQKYRQHRGLSVSKRKNFFGWYLYLKTI